MSYFIEKFIASADPQLNITESSNGSYTVTMDVQVQDGKGKARADASSEHAVHVWIADSSKGGETSTTPDEVTYPTGTALTEEVTDERVKVITDSSGKAQVKIDHSTTSSENTWYLVAEIDGKVYSAKADVTS